MMNDNHQPLVDRLELWGFDSAKAVFLLSKTIATTDNDANARSLRPKSLLAREFVDFQRWDRQLRQKCTHLQRLPTRRLRRLMELSWFKSDPSSGWRLELQKNVAVCEQWLNEAFQLLSPDQRQEFLDHDDYALAKQERAAQRYVAKKAKDLQQYFTTQSTIDFMLLKLTDCLKDVGISDIRNEELLWIEPSCGDGRVIKVLVDAGAHEIIGFELDAEVHRLAQKNLQDLDEKVSLYQGDFLTSTATQQNRIVVAVGNPPFGDKATNTQDMIHRFFHHTVHEWQASVIAFIVPERCSQPAFVAATLDDISTTTLAAKTTLSTMHPVDKWRIAHVEPLPESFFEFMVKKRVKQPSDLQIWTNLRKQTS